MTSSDGAVVKDGDDKDLKLPRSQAYLSLPLSVRAKSSLLYMSI